MSNAFWISLFILFYIYMGYPFFLWFVSFFFLGKKHLEPIEPSVSILISAYNEESCIGATLENKLLLDYPVGKKEIIVVSDGSTDRTEEIVRSFSSKGVQLIVQTPRQGKTAALNEAVSHAKGDVLIFSDANSLYEPSALRKLVAHFSDPSVGYVTGKMVYVDEVGSLVGSGCSAYMRYENMLRRLETKIGSVMGVDGGIDAVRKSLYKTMAPEMLPDFVLPLRVIEQGYKVIYEEGAVLKEPALTQNRDEWKMRVRVSLRSFHALWTMRSLLNPFLFPLTSFQLLSHKVLRYLAGFVQLSLLITNVLMVKTSFFFEFTLLLQGVFYLLSLIGILVPKMAENFLLIRTSAYLCLLNAAAMIAFLKFIAGKKQVLWTPRKG
ncbi:MAG: hypothetical protein KCHDKBKB_01495 [Elusimicrobia bacterium]|nr:hypothetical protein [Elusimicrobiota bacterium]